MGDTIYSAIEMFIANIWYIVYLKSTVVICGSIFQFFESLGGLQLPNKNALQMFIISLDCAYCQILLFLAHVRMPTTRQFIIYICWHYYYRTITYQLWEVDSLVRLYDGQFSNYTKIVSDYGTESPLLQTNLNLAAHCNNLPTKLSFIESYHSGLC